MFKRFRSSEQRHARRLARIAYWDRPIEGPVHRIRAWVHMLLADHGVFRLLYLNHHPVGAGRLWRSAQPAPHQIAAFGRQGVRTVICLRGQRESGSWQLQRDICERQGLTLVEVTVRSRAAPERETILEIKRVLEEAQYPAVIHCKAGADRAGLVAALYLMLIEQVPVGQAMRQLSMRYGHFAFSKTGVLDGFLEAYRDFDRATPTDFITWVTAHYDPEQVLAARRTKRTHVLISDLILRRE